MFTWMLSALCEKVIGELKKNFWNKLLENLKGIIDSSRAGQYTGIISK